LWEVFVPDVHRGARYKFHIESSVGGYAVQKADPFAFYSEEPPKTASIVWDEDYEWNDDEWMATRAARNNLAAPISIYEVHLGSWRRGHEGPLNYNDLATQLIEHVVACGFTHVQLLPITEHPFYGSWGYQTTGYFAPTSRYGDPVGFMHFVDRLHQAGIGVLLDWVPSHFPNDEHGLGYFDGTHLFEHADPRQGFHPDWGSLIFNYGRNEVRSFLISSASFWLDRFHIDGLRVDAVASMLYLDYSRQSGEWIPNRYGGRENIEAIEFLRQLNRHIGTRFPGTLTIAEESTAWPMVSRPPEVGGLGFHLKWDMGWMHDTLEYIGREPVHRRYHHNEITFRAIYMFNENFVMPLSHDEVVHGKGSLLQRMPGDLWQKFANLRLLYGYMFAQPGKKLLFMGAEIAQWKEWRHEEGLEWHLLEWGTHRGIAQWVSDLNRLYRETPALHELDVDPAGFEWVDASDADQSVISFLRKSKDGKDWVLIVCNFTPVVRHDYRVGVPVDGLWIEALNSDSGDYEGSGVGNLGSKQAEMVGTHGRPYSLNLTLPPLGILFLRLSPPIA
jgi:1,4-alpha-glucan branching enzyme